MWVMVISMEWHGFPARGHVPSTRGQLCTIIRKRGKSRYIKRKVRMKKGLSILLFQTVSYFSHLCEQITDKHNLREEGFVWGHTSEESHPLRNGRHRHGRARATEVN